MEKWRGVPCCGLLGRRDQNLRKAPQVVEDPSAEPALTQIGSDELDNQCRVRGADRDWPSKLSSYDDHKA